MSVVWLHYWDCLQPDIEKHMWKYIKFCSIKNNEINEINYVWHQLESFDKSEIECSANTQLEVRHRDFKLPLILHQHAGGGDTLECWRLYKMKLAKFDNRIEPKFVRAGGGSCALFKRLLSRAKNLSQMRSFSHLQPKAKYNYWLIGFILVGQKYQKVRKNQ